MSDFPSSPLAVTTPPFVTTFSRWSAAFDPGIKLIGPATVTWVANLAVYVPIILPWPYPLARLGWQNGSTVTGSGNVDIGLYNNDGVRLVSSGQLAQVGATITQFFSLATPTILSPGRYYAAILNTGTTNRMVGGTSAATQLRLIGVLQETTTGTLPAVMTPVTIANALYPLIALTKTRTGAPF